MSQTLGFLPLGMVRSYCRRFERDTEEVKDESEFALNSCGIFPKAVFQHLALQKLFREFGDRFQCK
jgi:hypothetical protein